MFPIAITAGLAAAFQATELGGRKAAQLIESARAHTPQAFRDTRDAKSLHTR